MKGFDWDDIKVFLALHRGHSVRAASRNLKVSHSTISRRIERFEDDLGARLFDRTAGGFVLTQSGEALLERAETLESEMIVLQRELAGRDAALSGDIVITLTPPVAQYLLMDALVGFTEAHPAIQIELQSSYSIADLGRREADIAVRFLDKPEDNLVGRRLPDFADAAYATDAYISAHSFQGPNATACWIGWDDVQEYPTWLRNTPFPDCRVKWRIPDILNQAAAARAELGMAYLPCFIGDPDTALVRVPPGAIVGSRPGWVLTHPDLRTTSRVRLCVKHIVEAIKAQESLISGMEAEL